VKFGHEGVGSYYLKAYFDTNGVALEGEYRDSASVIEGGLRAVRIGCDSTALPWENSTVVAPVD
jgi:hypothetical protein